MTSSEHLHVINLVPRVRDPFGQSTLAENVRALGTRLARDWQLSPEVLQLVGLFFG